MNFIETCLARFSARKYTNEPVSTDDMEYILESLRVAPSAVNRQPWKFVVVKSEEARERLQRCYDRDWFKTAPVYIVAYKNKSEEWVRKYDGKPHGDIDVAIAVEHICLAATDCGLGTCWVCNYNPQLLAELFPQPDGYEAVAIIPVGHIAPDCPTPAKMRKELATIVEEL
ncbi:MAG: nitroreductase family protein [Bacteroides sp.]|nr:nitroreductase family protein [Roseburia sp.]MCM1346329.1 nitroreductase family protein [Bacteroides sp.]MCM1420918.1 nitroreductase family protein [Bacteroides sp.]